MEDKKKKKEDKKKRETSQKVPEQKIKVPESAKPSCSQPLATPGSVSPSPGPVAPSSPSPGAAGVSAQVPPGGGNNAKQRTAVANGQPSSSPSGSQTSQQQRYMSREVPPRFRCQQDHKVLLKRGQPPLSSMLLGGGGGEGGTGGGSGWAATPPVSSQGADNPNASTAGGADSNLGSSSPSPPTSSSSSLCVAALSSSSTTTSTYANSTWGAGSGSQSSSQGCGKVIVDGTDLEDWPSILGGAKLSSDGAGGGVQEQDCPSNNNNNSSASWSERNIQQKGGAVGGGAGNMDNPSPPRTSPLSSSSSLNECVQSSGGGVWGSSTSSQVEAGLGSAAFYNSKVSHLLPGPQESPVSGSSSVSGANFNPNVNPSAWPALVQGGTTTSASDSLPLHSSITSASSFSASTTLITTHTLSSVNQTGLHQQHTETAVGARSGEPQQHLGNPGPELGSGGGARAAGPNQAGGDERDCGVAGVEEEGSGDLSGSSSSSLTASSSWRSMPPVSSDLSAGASQADGWGGGGAGAQGQEGNVWGFGSQGEKAGWGRGSDGGSNTPVVSQGAWEGGSSEVEWGGTAGGVSSSNLAIGSARGGDGSSNSSSSGGSVGIGGSVLPDSASPKFETMTKAWDNQKGMESGDGAVGEWGGGGGQGGDAGGGGPSSSSGGGSIAGSGGGGSGGSLKQNRASSARHCSHQTSNAEVALLSMLNRSDLDPRVLSNMGWGQTQIRQNVAWDLDTTAGVGNRNERSTSSSSSFSSATMNTTTSRGPGYPSNTSSVTNDPSSGSHTTSLNSGSASVKDGWDGGATQSACGPHMPGSTIRKPGMPEEDMEGNTGKAAGGWGDLPPENQGKGWGTDEQQWRDHRGGGGNRREFGEQGSGWTDGPEDKGTGGWKGTGRGEAGGWGGGGDWGQRDSVPGGGWGDGRSRGGSNSDEGSSWGNMDDGGSQRGGWGGGDVGGGKSHQDWGSAKSHAAAAQIPNSQVAPMKAPNQQQHQSQGQQPPGGPMQGGWNSRSNVGGGGPPSKNQNQSLGWTSGPIPQISGGGGDSLEPSGWEEPSPQSISRKMEIDDGTSAWGDPTHYNSKNVNLWDKNSATPSQSHGQQAPPPPPPPSMQQQPPRRQQGMQHSRDTNPGNAAVGMWGGAQSVDNGTAAWGQASDAATGWGDPDEPSKASGWGNPSPNPSKPGTKSMESWGGKGEGSVAASRHPSWDEEDDGGGGVWNSTGSQGSSSSFNSGSWGQTHGGKRGNIKSGGGDSWMNPVSRQFSNMGLLGDDPSDDKKMEGDKRGITDYNGEMRRGGRGGGGYRMPSSKDMGPVDMGPYGDKMGGHGVFVGSGGGMPQPRGMHQPGMHPMNPSQGLRAQVPHQFLSAQVPGPMLKQMPSPGGSVGGVVGGVGGVGSVGSVGGVGGVGGGVFPPQISPQQLAMLSNIYPHMQQFHLACQLLLQQQQQQQQLLQNQRKFPQPQPLRQQPDPQQLARIMAILQQQRQHQQGGVGGAAVGGGSSKLSPSHLGGGLSKQPMVDPLPHPGMGGPLSDLHAKTQGMYSGLAPGGNLSGLELGPMMGGMKDTGGQQSRFKWMMEGHSPTPSPPDTTLHKNGPLPSAIKVRGGSPYSQYEILGGDGLGIPPQGSADNWHRTPGSKMGNKPATSSWPPEFQPGVPWKGIQSSGDPESDPYMTPGSVLGSPGPPSLNDSDHQLLRDNIGPNPSLNTSLPSPGAWPYSASDSPLSNAHSTGKYSEYKPSWPPEPIGQNKLWKTNRNSSQLPRPPPGLTNQKQASPSPWGSGGPRLARSWGGGGINQESRFGPGSAWSDGVASRGSCWLLLSNLTPQIDGSTLRTICMQHGPLLTFHLGLTQGSALIRYSSRQEAAKAQGALHMCVLGNTTILAEFVSEEEVARYFAHSQAGGAEGASSGGAVASGTQGSSGTGTAVASSGGSSPGSERAAASTASGGSGNSGGGGESGAAVLGSVRSSGSGWQSLDGTGSSSETSSAQGPGLGIFSQWSTNGSGEGGGVGGVEAGRSGLWGGMTAGYPSSSLWGAPQMEERHQMDSPAALLPGDLLGGGADSI
ncbi:trinucleotide repeat-containing gene 6B protein-like [Lates japonicus]